MPKADLKKAIQEEAVSLIKEWDRIMKFVKDNNLPESLLNVALDNRLRLMHIRDGDSPRKTVDSTK